MKRTFKEAVSNRRSYYAIDNTSPIDDSEIEKIAEFALNNLPSAFNSQTTRMVLLFGKHHTKLWDIVKATLKAKLSEDRYVDTEAKIDGSFSCGYATILFFEDESVVKNLQENFKSYRDKFPQWSEHTDGIHQFAVWTMLEDAGFGASLQHYNPIIDEDVRKEWNIPETWKLIAQMPFGTPKEEPEPKEMLPVSERMKIFK
jgi:predicted oxidoreductase (fatty acid repression mutant protein)